MKSYKTNFEFNRVQNEYATIDLQTNIIDSLEVALTQFQRKDNLKWKTISINIFHALYLLCIANLERGNYENVLTTNNSRNDEEKYAKLGIDEYWKRARKIHREKSDGYTIKWEAIEGEPSLKNIVNEPIQIRYLINFWTAFARVQDSEVEMKGYIMSRPLEVSEDEWTSVERLFYMTEKFYNFIPTSCSIEIRIIRADLKNLLRLIKFLGLEAQQFFWYEDADNENFERLIEKINRGLDNKLIEKISLEKNNRSQTAGLDTIVYTEGNNKKYFEIAMRLFSISLPIQFHDYGGKNELQRHFKKLAQNKHSAKTIFLFDCDADKEYLDCKKNETEVIRAILIPRNIHNNKITTGIENLFPENLFSKEFFDEVIRRSPKGEQVLRTEFNKSRFYESIMDRNEKEDFGKFPDVFELIIKELSILNS